MQINHFYFLKKFVLRLACMSGEFGVNGNLWRQQRCERVDILVKCISINIFFTGKCHTKLRNDTSWSVYHIKSIKIESKKSIKSYITRPIRYGIEFIFWIQPNIPEYDIRHSNITLSVGTCSVCCDELLK